MSDSQKAQALGFALFVYAGTAAKEGDMNQECAVGYASEADIDAWMDLVALVRDAFPGLSLGEYRGNLRKAIAERRALCAKDTSGLLGVLVLSGETTLETALASDPQPPVTVLNIEEFGKLLLRARHKEA